MSENSGAIDRMSGGNGAFRWFARAQMWLAGSAIIAMMLVTVADVVMRYAFNSPVRGTYDFTEVMLTVFTFHGMAACFLNRTNIVIDLIDNCISVRVRSVLIEASAIICAALLVVMLCAASTPAVQAFGNGETKLQLGLAIWVVWAIALAGLAGALAAALSIVFSPRQQSMNTRTTS